MAKKHPAESAPTHEQPTDIVVTPDLAVEALPPTPATVEPVEPPKTGLALLQFEYADPKTGEPTPLKWKAREISDSACGIVSKFGTLLHPDGTVARFTLTEANDVRRYLVALRPNDEIQITNLQ